MRWKSKQKNKTKNIYLNKLPNISVWKQTFFRGLKKPCFTGGAGVNSSVSYSPPFKSPYPSGLALHSFYVCRLSTNVPKLRKSTVIVTKFFNEKFFQRLGYWVSPLTVQNRLDRRQVFKVLWRMKDKLRSQKGRRRLLGAGEGFPQPTKRPVQRSRSQIPYPTNFLLHTDSQLHPRLSS